MNMDVKDPSSLFNNKRVQNREFSLFAGCDDGQLEVGRIGRIGLIDRQVFAGNQRKDLREVYRREYRREYG